MLLIFLTEPIRKSEEVYMLLITSVFLFLCYSYYVCFVLWMGMRNEVLFENALLSGRWVQKSIHQIPDFKVTIKHLFSCYNFLVLFHIEMGEYPLCMNL